ncbi:MAG: hypothetical protein LBB98_10135 [Treponema sp.]|jgi:hypothetical protein|nr:hypothetical protein [Treponema sp.]
MAKIALQPDTEVENTRNHFEYLIWAINTERGDRLKPAGAYGVRYALQVGGEKPASGAELPKSKFNRKTTHIVQHTEADKGKTAYNRPVCVPGLRPSTVQSARSFRSLHSHASFTHI